MHRSLTWAICSKVSRLIGLFALGVAALSMVFVAQADTITMNFDSYSTGTINGQDGWSSTGAAGSGCATYDHAVVNNTYGYGTFGTKSLRISNAVTSGCFGDQTFSKSLVDEAGEAVAQNGGMSGGVRQPYFEAEWDFASTVPGSEQVGLSAVASPDRGDGARMAWVQMTDKPSGLEVNFYDYQSGVNEVGCPTSANFIFTNVQSGLNRAVPHRIKVTSQFVNGLNNDIVRVYIDGILKHTGTSWEGYFNECELNPTRTVDSILFRTGGAAAPATAGNGFLIDNMRIMSGPVPVATPNPTYNPNGPIGGVAELEVGGTDIDSATNRADAGTLPPGLPVVGAALAVIGACAAVVALARRQSLKR